jgi:hypothetical protein
MMRAALLLLLPGVALAQWMPRGGATSSGLPADPAACGAGQFVTDLAQTGALTCAAVGWTVVTDKPATFPATTPVATASALAADGADCVGAGEFAKGVTAAGVASGCAVPAGTYSLPALGIATLGGVKGRADTSLTCAGTDKATGFDAAGALVCAADVTGSGVDLSGEAFVTAATSANLSAERVLTAGTNTTIDTATPGQIKVNVSGLEPAGTYSGIGACAGGQYAHTLNDGAAPTCSTPPGTYALPDATNLVTGGVRLTTDLGGTATAPTVVDDSHAHGTTTIAALDAADVTTGTFAAAQIPAATSAAKGGVLVPAADCNTAATSKVLYTSATNTFSCGTDQTSAGGASPVYAVAATDTAPDQTYRNVWTVAIANTGGVTATAFVTGTANAATTGRQYRIDFSGTETAVLCVIDHFTAATTLAYTVCTAFPCAHSPTASAGATARTDKVFCTFNATSAGNVTIDHRSELVATNNVTVNAGSVAIIKGQ